MTESKIPQELPGGHTHSAAPLPDVFVAYMLKESHWAAVRLVRSGLYTRHEQEDLRQELLLDLLRRLPRYNDALGNPNAFAWAIIRNHAWELASRRSRGASPEMISLDSTIHSQELRTEGHGNTSDLRIEIERFIDRLPKKLKLVVQDLKSMSISEVCSRRGKSRSRVYQIVAEIRGGLSRARLGAGCPTNSALARPK